MGHIPNAYKSSLLLGTEVVTLISFFVPSFLLSFILLSLKEWQKPCLCLWLWTALPSFSSTRSSCRTGQLRSSTLLIPPISLRSILLVPSSKRSAVSSLRSVLLRHFFFPLIFFPIWSPSRLVLFLILKIVFFCQYNFKKG